MVGGDGSTNGRGPHGDGAAVPHELATILRDAAARAVLPADGSVRVLPAPPGATHAVVAFTAHHVIAADVEPGEVHARLPEGDLGAPMSAPFLSWLGERLGSDPGTLDVLLAAPDVETFGGMRIHERPDLADHPRAVRARRYRPQATVYSDEHDRGVLILGRGLAGRMEISIEVDPAFRSRGLARAMIAAARTHAPLEEPLFAQVAPGNVPSLRAFLAAGYRPIGAEVLFPKR